MNLNWSKVTNETTLTYFPGTTITVTKVDESGWWMGRTANGKTGTFPGNYVELVEDAPETMQPTVNPNGT